MNRQRLQYLVLAFRKDLRDGKTISEKDLTAFLDLLEPDIFFNLQRWISGAAASKQLSPARQALQYICVDDNNTIATNGKVACVYEGKLNGLESGLYNPLTLEKIVDAPRYLEWEHIFPKEVTHKIIFKINDFLGYKTDFCVFSPNGDIVNACASKKIGEFSVATDSKDGDINLAFSLECIGIALDRQSKEFIMLLDKNTEWPICLIDVAENCQAVLISKSEKYIKNNLINIIFARGKRTLKQKTPKATSALGSFQYLKKLGNLIFAIGLLRSF